MHRRGILFLIVAIFLTGFLFMVPYTVASAEPEEGLLGYWSFNELEMGGKVIYSENFEGVSEGALPEGWSGSIGDFSASSERAFSGTYSIRLANKASVRSPKVPIEEGVYYSALVQSFSRGDFRKYGASEVQLEFWDDKGNLLSAYNTLFDLVDPVDPQWREVAANGVAPVNAKYATVKISVQDFQDKQGLSFHDDVRIVEAATINDDSGNGRLGVVVGGAQLVDGRCGKALLFNGEDSYVEIPLSDGLQTPKVISIEAWIYPIPPHQVTQGGILNNINGAWRGRDSKKLLIMDNGTLVAQLYGYSADAFAGPVLKSGTWTHVVYVYDGYTTNEQAFYINGVKEAVAPGPSSWKMDSGDAPLKIGWGHDTYHNYFHFNGLIDEVKIYGRALSPEEVAYKYSHAPSLTWSGLMSYPNPSPSNESVKVAYFVDGECDVELAIYDESGRQILQYSDKAEGAGYHNMEWDGKDKNGNTLPPGLYLAVVSTIDGGKNNTLAKGVIVRVP